MTNREKREEDAYIYLSERGVLSNQSPQTQIDIQEALRIASGKVKYERVSEPDSSVFIG